MFSIQGFLTCKSKLPDELQTHLPATDQANLSAAIVAVNFE
jgi:hypothetical protein